MRRDLRGHPDAFFRDLRHYGRTLSPVENRTGLITELPPYHKPRWGNLLRNTLVRAWDVFEKAFVVVVVVAAILWGLSYSACGDLI